MGQANENLVPLVKTGQAASVIKKLFGKYLLFTNTLSAGLLMVAGDLTAQEIELRAKIKEAQGYDWKRVGM